MIHFLQVTLLSGGGSGHEPAQSGYVGHGMLSAVVCGAIFASPPPAAIFAALKVIPSYTSSLIPSPQARLRIAYSICGLGTRLVYIQL